MTCDGTGRLPCRCGAAEWNADLYEWNPRRAPCTCKDFACPGCDECRRVEAEAEAARRKAHAEDLAWYHAKIGTAPPRAKTRAKDDGGGAKGETHQQGSLFG